MPSKPFGICWCDCHRPVDDHGKRILKNEWPRFDNPVAIAVACVNCRHDHDLFVRTGRDWAYPANAREGGAT
jgi:hypothetical protein